MMRRSALVETGGYDPGLIAGEEPELGRRLRARGYLILHIDTPMTLHDLNMTRFRQYWLRAVRAGYAYAEISERFSRTADPMWREESRGNLIRGVAWIVWLSIGVALAAIQKFGHICLDRGAGCVRDSVSLESPLQGSRANPSASAIRDPLPLATGTGPLWSTSVSAQSPLRKTRGHYRI